MGNSFSRIFSHKGGSDGDRGDLRPPGHGPSGIVDFPQNTPGSSVDWGIAGLTDGDDTDVEAAVREAVVTDVEVDRFDKDMEKKTEHVLGSLEKNMQEGGVGLGSLKDVTTGLVDMDSEVSTVILNCDEKIWANEDMKDLVIEYFNHSTEALEFCHLLEKSVRGAQDNQMPIEFAIKILPQDRDPTADECRRILQELREFQDAKNPFSDFTQRFNEVYDKQKKFHEILTERIKKLKRKSRLFSVLKRVTTVMLTATGISLVIFAAVAMALAAPLVPNLSVRAAAELPFQTMRASIRNLWSGYEQRISQEQKVMETAKWTTGLAIVDLQTIQIEVDRLTFEIKSIIDTIEFGQSRKDPLAVRQIIPRLKRKQESFVKQLEELTESIRKAFERLNSYRSMVLDRITSMRNTGGSVRTGSTRHHRNGGE